MPRLRSAARIGLAVALFFAFASATAAAPDRRAPAAPAQPAAGLFGANLVVNGNAEAGPGTDNGSLVASIPGWPGLANMSVVKYSALNVPGINLSTMTIPPNHGANFFAGIPGTPRPYIEQDIDLAAGAATLDGGQAVANFGLYLGGAGTYPDRATATVTFLDANKAATGAVLTIDPISRSAGRVGVWRKSVYGAVPVGARWARVRVGIPVGTAAPYAPWFADNISLILSEAATGQPGTYRVYLPGLMGGSGAPAPKPTPVPPAAPTNLRATATSPASILLQWDDNSNNEAGFQVERQNGASWTLIGTAVANQTTYTDQGLTPATAYTYRVRATGATGASAYSNAAGATTLAPALLPPAPPTHLQAANTTATSTYLTWQDNATNETGFKLEMLLYPGDYQEIGVGSLGPNATGIQVVDLPPGAQMRFRVTAYNAAGNSGSPADGSNEVRVTTLTQTASTPVIRFQNNTSHPIIYLTVDGQQMFPASPYSILPGNYYDVEVTAGPHSFEARNGFWQDNGTRFEMWVWTGTATAVAGSPVAVSFDDPTIQQQLTDFQPSGVWAGWYFDNAANYYEAWFCFYANGRFRYYVNGKETATGAYGAYVPGQLFDRFNVLYDSGQSYGAMYYPTFGQFDMSNGAPGDLFVEYVRRLGQTCAAPAP